MPQPMDMEAVQADVLDAMRKSGVDEAVMFAYQKTGMLLSEGKRHAYPEEAVEAWNAAIEEYRAREKELADWSWKNPGFKGVFEFDIAIGMLGKRVERHAKVDYTHTPEWEYWDPNKKTLFTGVHNSSFTLSILTKPERNEKDKPERVQMSGIIQNGVLCNEVRDAIDDKLDERCRTDDAEPH
jgi:hypothetical protein